MNTRRRLTSALSLPTLLVLMLLIGACGAQPTREQTQATIDARAMDVLPADAQLVSHGSMPRSGLFYEAAQDGQIYLLSNGEVVTVLPVEQGDRVELNEWTPTSGPWTQLRVNDDVTFSRQNRSGDNRFYFRPASPDEASASE